MHKQVGRKPVAFGTKRSQAESEPRLLRSRARDTSKSTAQDWSVRPPRSSTNKQGHSPDVGGKAEHDAQEATSMERLRMIVSETVQSESEEELPNKKAGELHNRHKGVDNSRD